MNVDYIAFNNTLASCGVDPVDQRCVASYAIAQAIANCLPLPSSPVENVENYYLMSLKTDASFKLGEFNEAVILDGQEAIEAIRSFWMLRYATLYPNAVANRLVGQYGYFDTMMGVGLFVSDDIHKFVNCYKTQIFCLFQQACVILMKGEARNSPSSQEATVVSNAVIPRGLLMPAAPVAII